MYSGGPTFLHIGWRASPITNGAPASMFRLEAIGADHSTATVYEGPQTDALLQVPSRAASGCCAMAIASLLLTTHT